MSEPRTYSPSEYVQHLAASEAVVDDYAHEIGIAIMRAGAALERENEGIWDFSGPDARALAMTVLESLTDQGWVLTPPAEDGTQ